MRKIIGALIIIIILGFFVGVTAYETGLKMALIVWGVAIAITVITFIAAWLLVGE